MDNREIVLERIYDYVNHLNGKVVLGIDGIIDDVWQVIEARQDKHTVTIMEHMKDFGDMIVQRGKGGLAKEIQRKRKICGGFTANTGRALGQLNLETVMVGMYGREGIEPIYKEFEGKCSMISLSEPAVCNIFEFIDGKVMMTCPQPMIEFTWDDFQNKLGSEGIKALCQDTKIFCLGYWSNMPDFDEILTKLVHGYFNGKEKRLFFDFANLTKKSTEALERTLALLKELNAEVPMTLSFNEHEGALLLNHFGLRYAEQAVETENALRQLQENIGIDEVVIHTPYDAFVASAQCGSAHVAQQFCEHPVKTAGAGDSFNGGYVAASLGSLRLREKLALANATTNYYVQNGFPPEREALCKHIGILYK